MVTPDEVGAEAWLTDVFSRITGQPCSVVWNPGSVAMGPGGSGFTLQHAGGAIALKLARPVHPGMFAQRLAAALEAQGCGIALAPQGAPLASGEQSFVLHLGAGEREELTLSGVLPAAISTLPHQRVLSRRRPCAAVLRVADPSVAELTDAPGLSLRLPDGVRIECVGRAGRDEVIVRRVDMEHGGEERLPVEVDLGRIELSVQELLMLRAGSEVVLGLPGELRGVMRVEGSVWAVGRVHLLPEGVRLEIEEILPLPGETFPSVHR